eukprot:3454145-Rhodomonas_salina.3
MDAEWQDVADDNGRRYLLPYAFPTVSGAIVLVVCYAMCGPEGGGAGRRTCSVQLSMRIFPEMLFQVQSARAGCGVSELTAPAPLPGKQTRRARTR